LELEEHKRPSGLVAWKQPKVGIETTRYVGLTIKWRRGRRLLCSRAFRTQT